MILKKFHFLIFLLVPIILMTLQSCKKEQQISPESKSNFDYDKTLDLAEKNLGSQNFDSAFYYYNKIKSNCDPNKEEDEIIYALLRMAYIQQTQGDYSSSETSATEAISYFKKNTDSYYKVASYNLLAINYKQLFDFDNSIYYYKQALNLAEDNLQKAVILNNIAVVYMDKNKYSQAIKILMPLSLKKEVINNSDNHARVLDNLGRCYYKIGNHKSIDYLKQSLAIRSKFKNDYGMTTSYLNISEFYEKTQPYLATKYAKLAYEKATTINNVDDRLKALASLIRNSDGNQSKTYSAAYLLLNDSIHKVRQKAKNQFAKIKYDSKKERDENLKLKTQRAENALQIEQQKNSNLFLSFVIVLGIIATLFLIYFFKERSKKEKIKASYDTETRISKKLHDELANDVFHAMAFAETQDLSTSENKELLLTNLDTIYSRTRNISKENSIIETGIHFVGNLKEMMAAFNTQEVNILVTGWESCPWNILKDETKITLYRVLQELLVNMKKHSKCSLVVITFKKNKNKLEIDYSDNGLGATSEEINMKNGLQNVENRILGIKGTITFDTISKKGFKVSFTLPI